MTVERPSPPLVILGRGGLHVGHDHQSHHVAGAIVAAIVGVIKNKMAS